MSFSWQRNNCSGSAAPKELSFSTAIISLGFCVVAAPCNLLICLTIYKDPHKNLRTPFNLLILNVALADLIQGVLVLPLSAAYHGMEGFQNASSQLLKALHLFFFISCTASIMSIGALAVDRCIAVSYPFRYRSESSYSRSVRISILIWLISASLSFVYFHVDFIIYTFVFVNSVILVTVFVLIVVHHWVKRSLRNHRKRREFQLSTDFNKKIKKSSSFNGHRGKMIMRHTRMTHTFLAILMAFLLLSTPSFVFAYLLNFCNICGCNTLHVFRDLHFLFVLFPSSVNPFLFGLRLPHFKRALMVVISRRKRNSHEQNYSKDVTSTAEDDGLSSSQHRRRGSCCYRPSLKQKSTLENPFLREINKNDKIRNGNIELGIVNKDLNCLELDEESKQYRKLGFDSSFSENSNPYGRADNGGFESANLRDYRLTSIV
ncbi:histamine H2 receptor-like [Exaiptasia diaphana]|uniref:G-protein coupled receptors family 1 profile domain-containing protein n=1 Tax=Exaiptasia diaphana TaxID=2652724 RepID=A0A913Y7F3_EXADI|nr:histamine H2 receptor-like [Exaiptasia diaphana]